MCQLNNSFSGKTGAPTAASAPPLCCKCVRVSETLRGQVSAPVWRKHGGECQVRGAFPAVGLGRLCSLQSGGPEAIGGSARLQGGGGAQTPQPTGLGWGACLKTCILASEPNGVRHLVAAGSSAGAGAASGNRRREAFPVPAPCPVLLQQALSPPRATWAEPHTLAAQPSAPRRRIQGPGYC